MAMDNVRRGLKAPWPPAEEHVPAAGIATAASAALAGDTSSAAGAYDDLQTAMDEMDSAEFLIRSGLGRVSAVGGFALSEDAESVLQRLDDGTIPTRDADNDAWLWSSCFLRLLPWRRLVLLRHRFLPCRQGPWSTPPLAATVRLTTI